MPPRTCPRGGIGRSRRQSRSCPAAIGRGRHAFKDASANLTDDRSVVLAVIGQSWHALKGAFGDLKATAMWSRLPQARIGMPSRPHPRTPQAPRIGLATDGQ